MLAWQNAYTQEYVSIGSESNAPRHVAHPSGVSLSAEPQSRQTFPPNKGATLFYSVAWKMGHFTRARFLMNLMRQCFRVAKYHLQCILLSYSLLARIIVSTTQRIPLRTEQGYWNPSSASFSLTYRSQRAYVSFMSSQPYWSYHDNLVSLVKKIFSHKNGSSPKVTFLT